MCGIVAVVSKGPLDDHVIDRMRDRLIHRGPDGGRSWRTNVGDTTVAFGHRRLSIIDLSHDADQPMFDPSGRLALIYNGEIYNYVELRSELSAGRHFRTSSDTEVLLAAYERWGTECLGHLNGMFSFALWDQHKRELFVARDRFGEKPLFFAHLPTGGIAFASEMKALFAHDAIDARVHWPSVAAYAAGDFYEDRGQTMFEGVERLMQAEAMIVGADGEIRRRWRYWTPDYETIRDDYREPGAFDEFRELLDRSVRMRLRSDVPIGTSLSGGLDSSLIVCLLAGLRGENPMLTQNTFSGRFDTIDPTLSEGREIDLVVEHSGVQAYAVVPTAEGLIAESGRLHWHQEEPFLSASIYLQWCVMRIAKEQQTTVLLDGQGADELLAGYQYYFPTYQLDLLDRMQLVRLVQETVLFRRRLQRASANFENSDRRFNKDIALSFAALMRARVRKPSVWRGPYEVGVPAAVQGSRLRRVLAEALQYNSLPQLLRYADRNAMAFSRETRFPFLDHELVDWCIQLPDRAFVAEGWQKWILRRSAQNLIPPEIQWRADKVGYAAPLDLWLRGPLRDWARSRIDAAAQHEVPGYDAAAVRQLWSEHQGGVANHSWALWRWISLAEWLTLAETGAWKNGVESTREQVAIRSGGRA